MSQLSIPNDIVDGTLIEASEHQQNYKQIESFVNDELLHADGSVAMDAGAELLLGKAASVPLGAVTKAQLDNAVFGDVPGGGFLPLAGGTLTGDLQVDGKLSFNGVTQMYSQIADTWKGLRTKIDGQFAFDFYSVEHTNLIYRNLRIKASGDGAGDLRVDGDLQVDGQILASRGLSTAPGLSFATYKGTGFYPGSTNVATHVNGVWQFVVYEDKTRVIRDLQVDANLRVDGIIHAVGTKDNERDAPANVHINDSGYLYKTKVGSLPLSGGTVTGDLKVDGNLQLVGTVTGDLQIGAYSSGLSAKVRWTVGNAAIYGQDGGSWKGMRFLVNGTAELDLYDAEYPSLFHRGLRVKEDLRVEGQTLAQNGTKAKPAYSFNSDTKTGIYLENASSYPSASIISITANGVNAANFGDKGVSLPVAYAQTTGAAPNVHIDSGGQILRSTSARVDAADISRLETLVEKLSARIDMLEGQKGL